MDTLALLCNLHADGPATLQRLRRAGCESLAVLRRMDPLRLAERMEWSERAAERFLREASLLSGRVEPEEEDAEDFEEPEFELESELVQQLDGTTDEFEEEGEEEAEELEPEEEAEEVYQAPPAERLEVVLGAWRELDRVSPPSDPVSYEIPRPAPEPDLALAAVGLTELSPRLVARLAEHGVKSLRQLVAADGLELARALTLGFTRVKHLQFLAERELERLPPVQTATPAMPTFDAYLPPPNEPFETAGPFA